MFWFHIIRFFIISMLVHNNCNILLQCNSNKSKENCVTGIMDTIYIKTNVHVIKQYHKYISNRIYCMWFDVRYRIDNYDK